MGATRTMFLGSMGGGLANIRIGYVLPSFMLASVVGCFFPNSVSVESTLHANITGVKRGVASLSLRDCHSSTKCLTTTDRLSVLFFRPSAHVRVSRKA